MRVTVDQPGRHPCVAEFLDREALGRGLHAPLLGRADPGNSVTANGDGPILDDSIGRSSRDHGGNIPRPHLIPRICRRFIHEPLAT